MRKECAHCGEPFETNDPRKIYVNKQHADRARNGVYTAPSVVQWNEITELRHFGKLDRESKARVLLGKSKFSVVMFDLEATHLKANVGRILCCSFKPLGKPVYTFTGHQKGLMKPDVYDDAALAEVIRTELEKFDIIVGHNSKDFDVRYINARNLRAGQRTKRAQHHVDTYHAWKSKAAAWSGLDSVQQFLELNTRKTKIEWKQWMRALGWSKSLREAAMAEIVDHCEKDVTVLEEAYRIMAQSDVIRSLRVDGGIL